MPERRMSVYLFPPSPERVIRLQREYGIGQSGACRLALALALQHLDGGGTLPEQRHAERHYISVYAWPEDWERVERLKGEYGIGQSEAIHIGLVLLEEKLASDEGRDSDNAERG